MGELEKSRLEKKVPALNVQKFLRQVKGIGWGRKYDGKNQKHAEVKIKERKHCRGW